VRAVVPRMNPASTRQRKARLATRRFVKEKLEKPQRIA
jgi:hypothetical protein